MGPPKKSSKAKKRPAEQRDSQESIEPSLEELAESVETNFVRADNEKTPARAPRPASASTSSATSVLKAPEALSNDLIQEMPFEIDTMRKLRNEHQQEMIFIQAKLAAKNEDNFQWKKEGNPTPV